MEEEVEETTTVVVDVIVDDTAGIGMEVTTGAGTIAPVVDVTVPLGLTRVRQETWITE